MHLHKSLSLPKARISLCLRSQDSLFVGKVKRQLVQHATVFVAHALTSWPNSVPSDVFALVHWVNFVRLRRVRRATRAPRVVYDPC